MVSSRETEYLEDLVESAVDLRKVIDHGLISRAPQARGWGALRSDRRICGEVENRL
jgi:hypothetical protein